MATGQLSKVVCHIRRLLCAPGGSDQSDRELLRRFAEHRDQEAFAVLVRRHGPIVVAVCRRILDDEHEAEDAFQAVFLVLARKASSVQWRESVGNWLYQVAHRTAQQARARRSTRQKHELQAGAMHAKNPTNGGDWHELQQMLDDELMRLPEKYRMPLLLCYVHGKTRDEAADDLGWSSGALKGCLERGREMLRNRLARRGLTFSALLLPALLAQGNVTALSASLLDSTVKAVAADTVSSAAAALAQGVMHSMIWIRVKLWLLVLVTVGAIGSTAGVIVYRGTAAEALAPLPDDLPGVKALQQPPGPLVIGDESNGKTVSVPVGRAIEVHLTGTRAQTGWEGGQLKGDALRHLNSGAPPDRRPSREGLESLPFGNEFLPQPQATDKAIGTYIFCYQAVKEGRAEINMDYITPGGPGVRERRRSARIAEFKVTIDVTASTAKASRPAVKDGLAVTLTISKATFAPDDKPGLEIAYENKSDKPFRLYDLGYEVSYFTYKRTDNGTSFQAGPWEYSARPAPQSVSVDPGKAHLRKLELSGPFQRGDARAESLPPGKYALTATIGFRRGADNNLPPYWVGNISTNPVEIEIEQKRASDVRVPEPPEKMSVEQLVADLDSTDGAKRAAATKEIFRRGPAILKDLEKAGAKPVKTIQPPRLDMIYSLLAGLPGGNYTTGNFGIHLNQGMTRKDVSEMGKKYGFSLNGDDPFQADGHPSCYVSLAKGKDLAGVLRQVLSEEARVVTVNLNYVER